MGYQANNSVRLKDVGVVLNYYTNFAHDAKRRVLVTTTNLSLRLLMLSPVVRSIVVVDGSDKPDSEMQSVCNELGVIYHHHGREVSYVDSYNTGWELLDEPYVVLMANDIIPHPNSTLERLREFIDISDVGCVFPYFASNRMVDDEIQQLGFGTRGKLTCEPSSMTLNLNMFKRNVLEEIGGLHPDYKSSYAEPILLLAIRGRGYRVLMVGGTRVIHYDQLTKSLGQSNIEPGMYAVDTARWFEEFPEYASRRGLASINIAKPPFSTRLSARALYFLVSWIPFGRLRRRCYALVMWIEPALTRIKIQGIGNPARDDLG